MKETEEKVAAKPAAPSVHRGPMEGVLIVNGRPQIEPADMPCISFASIEAIRRLNEANKEKSDTT